MPAALVDLCGPEAGVGDDAAFELCMAEFAYPQYSRTTVRNAGKVLAGVIPAPQTEAEKEELAHWFRVAHNWRRSHLYPMHRIRAELRARANRHEQQAVVVARLKRMSSIRRKLRNRALHQIQDIGGCRVIFGSMAKIVDTIAGYEAGDTRHELLDQDNHILVPKADGYRSHHLILKYQGDDPFSGLRIEIQLRTRLQHTWATAVEAVGLYRNEDLKGGRGDARWLRFFQIMASEIACAECLPIVPSVDRDPAIRREELRDLNSSLRVVEILEQFRHAVNMTDNFYRGDYRYYLMNYDARSRALSVSPYDNLIGGVNAYDREDALGDAGNAVLVEVDKVEDLKDAFPNYFLDVALFLRGLKRVLRGQDVEVPNPSIISAVRNAPRYDLGSVLRDWHRRRPSSTSSSRRDLLE